MTLASVTRINRKWLQIGAAIAIALVMLNIALTLKNSRSLLEDAQQATGFLEAQAEVGELLNLISSAESAQRGFIITGEEGYLEPYHESVERVRSQLALIGDVTESTPTQRALIEQLTSHASAKLEQLENSIEFRRDEGFEAARRAVDTDRGKREMDSIRQMIEQLMVSEQEKFASRDDKISRTYWTTLLGGLGSGLAALTAILVFMVVSRRYIEEREANSLELSERTERLKTTLASIGDAVITTDARGIVANLNKVAEQLTGWRCEEARGQHLPDVFQVVDQNTGEPVDNPALKALRSGEIVGFSERTVLQRRDGSELPIDDSAAPIRRQDQRVIGSILVFRDVSKRREQEKQLQKSEATFRATFDLAPIGIAHVSLGGQFLRVNAKLGDILGYEPAELCGLNYADLTHQEDIEDNRRSVAKLLAGELEVYTTEKRYRRKDGKHVWTNLTSSLVRDESGSADYFLTMIEDITEWRHAESNRIRLAAIVSSSNDAIIGKTFDGTVTSWNPAAERLFGFSEADMVGNSILKIVSFEHQDEELTLLQKLRDGESVDQHETFRRHKDGRLLNVLLNLSPIKDSRGKSVGVSTIVRDVTRQRAAEASLRESQARFQMMADNISQFAWMADAKGNIYWYNKRWYDYTGTTLEEMKGWGWKKVHHPDYVDRVTRKIQHSWDTGENWEDTFPLRGKDGQYRWFLSRALPICDSNGEIVTWFGTNTDITDLKQYEESLQEARRAAENANNSRGEFLANMSHEIRTPMTAILGHADILAEHVRDPDNLQCVETIRRNGKFLLQIINDILDLSKIDAGRLKIDHERVEPELILADVRSLMDVRAQEKNLHFDTRVSGKLPRTIETDPVRLRQILLNLVGNALKFTDEGEVLLSASYDPAKTRMKFQVSDTGIGIEQDDLQFLFKPFTQADSSSTRAYEGSGLGLAISRRLARALGGDISVESVPGDGSVFTLAIDCGDVRNVDLIVPSLTIREVPSETNGDSKVSGLVLVVDDRRDIRYLAQHFIEKSGGTVITACNGREAVELLTAEDAADVDVVVMDMQMPVMDGYTAARTLREQGFDKPIIALTANAMKDDRDKCLESGCTDYTTKPLDGNKFISLISKYERLQR